MKWQQKEVFVANDRFYTVFQKVSTFKLSVTLSNLNRFSNFALMESIRNLLQNPYHNTHLSFGLP